MSKAKTAKKAAATEDRVFVHEVIALAQANIKEDPATNPPVTTEPTPATSEEAFVPSPTNAPEGMVFCRVCKKHVPKKDTFPTTEYGVAMCKKACDNQTSIQAAAKAASAKVTTKPAKAPKAASEPRGLFALTDVLTAIKANPKKKGTKAELGFNAYREGMTVQEYLALAKDNGFYGRDGLAYDHRHAFITIVTATEYAAILAERAAEVKEA